MVRKTIFVNNWKNIIDSWSLTPLLTSMKPYNQTHERLRCISETAFSDSFKYGVTSSHHTQVENPIFCQEFAFTQPTGDHFRRKHVQIEVHSVC